MRIIRFFWLALFVVLVGTASFLAEEIFFPIRSPFKLGSIEYKIHKDLSSLKENKELPKSLNEVRKVYILDQRKSKDKNINWAELSKTHFPQGESGKYDLQIEIFTNENPNEKPTKSDNLFLQFSLFEKETKNKVWELSRSYNNF